MINNNICSIINCSNKIEARGLCKKHYNYYRRHNNLPPKQPYKRPKRQKDELVRFWERVDKKNVNDCWIWKAGKDIVGYGNFQLDDKSVVKAHRYSFLITNGYLDNNKFICHSCDNPSCVNPKHLWEGTAADNNADCRNKNRAVPPPDQKGENHSQHILTEHQVLDIRKKFENGIKQAELMRMYGISRNAIHKICQRKTWKHIGETNEST